jgi:hypothetical protein
MAKMRPVLGAEGETQTISGWEQRKRTFESLRPVLGAGGEMEEITGREQHKRQVLSSLHPSSISVPPSFFLLHSSSFLIPHSSLYLFSLSLSHSLSLSLSSFIVHFSLLSRFYTMPLSWA